ncbi:hypothetical protein [Aggregatilinea lenta]|uniref:hypothetical protein n=1 Tax=Aggregatilinea lenta TaxID=913108 RepID=UPI000E5BFB82|nr:hypothetical protein [Aggregatilinea lenta]
MFLSPFKLYRRLFGLAVLLFGGGTVVMASVAILATGSFGSDRVLEAISSSNTPDRRQTTLGQVVERRPLFEEVPLPSELSRDEDVVATNVGLAILLAIIFGIITTTLGNIVREEEATFRRWFSVPGLRELLSALDWSAHRSVRSGCLALPAIAAVFLLYGVIFAFLENGTDVFSTDGAQLVAVMALSVGLISLAGDFAQRQVALLWRRTSRFGLYPANLLIAAATTIVSRVFHLSPGVVFGVPGGVDIDLEDEPLFHEVLMAFATLVVMAILGGLGWTTAALVNSLGDESLTIAQADLAGPLLEFAFAVGLALFLVAIETAFFEMVPLSATMGSEIFRWNPLVWFGTFLPLLFLFVHSLLNPNGEYLEAFEHTNMQALMVMIVVLGTLTAALWLYFNVLRPDAPPHAPVAPPYVPPPPFQPPAPYFPPQPPPDAPPPDPRRYQPPAPPAQRGYTPPPIVISDDAPPPIIISDDSPDDDPSKPQ